MEEIPVVPTSSQTWPSKADVFKRLVRSQYIGWMSRSDWKQQNSEEALQETMSVAT